VYQDMDLKLKIPFNQMLLFIGFLYRLLYFGRFILINTSYKNPRS
jgi:hypothetical protein